MYKNVTMLLGALITNIAEACSCVQGDLGPREGIAEMLASADAVVLAKATTVTSTEMPSPFGVAIDGEITQFYFSRSWKGGRTNPIQTRIITACCMCGVKFEPGKTYLLYLSGPDKEGFYSTNLCVGAKLATPLPREEQVKILDELTRRQPPR